MDFSFFIGLIGSLVLVTGAAWPESKKPQHPTQSIKNWLFAIGSSFMMAYAILGYLSGGSIFFVFLQILVAISTILMMLDIDDRIDMILLTISSVILIIWSMYLFQGYTTLFFILGLAGIGFGYAFKMGTTRRNLALTLGSALISFFSYIEKNWMFFVLNLFFAIFSAYYLQKNHHS